MLINLVNLDENPEQANAAPKTKPDLVLTYGHGCWLSEDGDNQDASDLIFAVSLHKKAKNKNATIVYGDDEAKIWFT